MFATLGDGLGNRFIFPAPEPSYGPQSYKRHLCWIPWNRVISPQRAEDERCGDGIPCLWFPAPKAATVIIFFHANAEDLGMSFAVLKHMRDQFKVNVLAVEYPGYGLLNGLEPSEDGIYEVALTAFRYLVDEIGVRYSQIILFGRSLGSGPAVYLAAQYPVGGLILVSAFSSVRAAVQSIVGRFVAWTFKERFPNSRIIANVSCSTLLIHGECDGLIPADHSLRLFKRCRARKLLITPPRMEHNSNLFGDASFLAVPAIHFFGFPGYYTSTPPRLPASIFESPERRRRITESERRDSSLLRPRWLCDCLAKSDPHHMDVAFCRSEQGVGEEGAEGPPASASANLSGFPGGLMGQGGAVSPEPRNSNFPEPLEGDEPITGKEASASASSKSWPAKNDDAAFDTEAMAGPMTMEVARLKEARLPSQDIGQDLEADSLLELRRAAASAVAKASAAEPAAAGEVAEESAARPAGPGEEGYVDPHAMTFPEKQALFGGTPPRIPSTTEPAEFTELAQESRRGRSAGREPGRRSAAVNRRGSEPPAARAHPEESAALRSASAGRAPLSPATISLRFAETTPRESSEALPLAPAGAADADNDGVGPVLPMEPSDRPVSSQDSPEEPASSRPPAPLSEAEGAMVENAGDDKPDDLP